MSTSTLRIARRFNGPPHSGNGGYVCGRLAQYVGGNAIVRLQVPPPLERELAVVTSAAGAELLDGDRLIATAQAASLDPEDLPVPDFAAATEAATHYRGFRSHGFPTCFVCGPARTAGDGLRIFAGPLAKQQQVAAPWIPDASLAAADGVQVAPEFLWAALDCPGAFSFPEPPSGLLLLGQLQASVYGSVRVGERCVVIGRERSREGRRHFTTTQLYDSRGNCVAAGHAVWFEISAAPSARD